MTVVNDFSFFKALNACGFQETRRGVLEERVRF
jgi:hypothetical protein